MIIIPIFACKSKKDVLYLVQPKRENDNSVRI